MPYDVLNIGYSRVVYDIGDNKVLKKPYTLFGKIQSQNEWNKWQQYKNTNLLATIYDYNENTGEIIMEKLYSCFIDCTGTKKEYLNLIDNNGVQVGYDINGNLKLFDYGDCKFDDTKTLVNNFTYEEINKIKSKTTKIKIIKRG